jgi:hypothetical protein
MNEDSLCETVRASVPHAVRIGGMAKETLLETLRAQGVMLNAIGMELFADARFTTKPVREMVNVACVSVAGLGFRSWSGHVWSPDDLFVFCRHGSDG